MSTSLNWPRMIEPSGRGQPQVPEMCPFSATLTAPAGAIADHLRLDTKALLGRAGLAALRNP